MEEVSTVSFDDWLPLIIAIVGLVGGAVIYQIQKATDRRNQILQERRELYRRVVVSTRELLATWFDESEKKHIVSKHIEFETLVAELLVCAPDDVVVAIKSLESSIRDGLIGRLSDEKLLFEESELSTDEILATSLGKIESAFDNAVFEMRKDTFGDSVITKAIVGAIVDGFPISVGIKLP